MRVKTEQPPEGLTYLWFDVGHLLPAGEARPGHRPLAPLSLQATPRRYPPPRAP